MTQLAKVEKATTAPARSGADDEASALISMIERAARDPNVDLDKMERLFVMQQAAHDRRAKAAYFAALSEMQPKMPVVGKRGAISKYEKDDRGGKTGRQEVMTRYAKWEDVVEAIRPTMAEHGFAISFRIAYPTPDRILVTGVLSHAEGHSEETSMSLPIDNSGAKNNVQAWGSSVSYGKRYTAFALLNIVARDEDDDGKLAGGAANSGLVTADQVAELQRLIDLSNADAGWICERYSIETLADMTAKQFGEAKTGLTARLKLGQRGTTHG